MRKQSGLTAKESTAELLRFGEDEIPGSKVAGEQAEALAQALAAMVNLIGGTTANTAKAVVAMPAPLLPPIQRSQPAQKSLILTARAIGKSPVRAPTIRR